MNDTSRPLVVTAASGHIGSRLAHRLLDAGRPVRVMSRSEKNLAPFVERGAEGVTGSVEDVENLKRAFDGAGMVFTLIPPDGGADYQQLQERVSRAYVEALKATGVQRVVNLSSVGAHLEEGTGPILGLAHHERRLDAIPGLDVLHLRPASFMENHLMSLTAIRKQGLMASALAANVPMAQIATRDIGDAAAEEMLEGSFTGRQVRELLGPRDVSMGETAKILGDAIGKPNMAYVQLSEEQAEKAFVAMGVPPKTAALMLEMYRGFNEAYIVPTQERSERTETPTTLETWAEEVFAPAYREAAG